MITRRKALQSLASIAALPLLPIKLKPPPDHGGFLVPKHLVRDLMEMKTGVFARTGPYTITATSPPPFRVRYDGNGGIDNVALRRRVTLTTSDGRIITRDFMEDGSVERVFGDPTASKHVTPEPSNDQSPTEALSNPVSPD